MYTAKLPHGPRDLYLPSGHAAISTPKSTTPFCQDLPTTKDQENDPSDLVAIRTFSKTAQRCRSHPNTLHITAAVPVHDFSTLKTCSSDRTLRSAFVAHAPDSSEFHQMELSTMAYNGCAGAWGSEEVPAPSPTILHQVHDHPTCHGSTLGSTGHQVLGANDVS